ncbi:unnamed protein product [Miscanthus lutarioriparius]|uniref:Beta-fructofuranosidase n=1 Tax=Miscanthus lutarioriparius TaxID=422564 RepID=A0A811SJM8_9POAL|nr:unnamed protein product [Miscanthus lutarioriparius]
MAWLLLLQLAGASHVVYENLEAEAATAKVPPSIVNRLLRTGYHFHPPKNWINAPMYYRGWYHFFYQFNPKGAVWNNIVRLLVQLGDRAARRHSGDHVHGHQPPQHQLPGPERGLPKEQVRSTAPGVGEALAHQPRHRAGRGINVTQFRDPTTAWRAADRQWRLLIGSATEGGSRGVAYVYRSRDFRRWTRVRRPLHSAATGMWECPDFYPVSTDGRRVGLETSVSSSPQVKHVLKNSLDLWRYDYYTVGTYDRKAERSDTTADDVAKGWAGIQAIPRTVWLDPGGKQLLRWPIEEVEAALRGKSVTLMNRVIKPGHHVQPLDPALAYDAERLCGVKRADVKGGVGPFGLWVLASANLKERTAVFFRVLKAAGSNKPVVLLRAPTLHKSSLNPNVYRPTFAGFVDTDISNGKISLRSLIDRSVVESFGAGGKTCILSRVYPSLAIGNKAHLYVFNNGRMDVKVSRLAAWG